MKNTCTPAYYLRLAFWKLLCGQRPTVFKLHQIWKLLINVVRGEQRRKSNEKRLNLKIPPLCTFSITQRCNLNCTGCYTKNYRSDKSLTTEELHEIIEKVYRAGTYSFVITGGEPLLIKNILPLLGRYQHCIFFLFTNGTLLGEKEINELKKHKQIVLIISTEGSVSQTDSRRGEGVSARLSKVFSLLKKAQLPFGCAVMATHRNLGYITLRDFWERIRKRGAAFGLVIDYVPFAYNINPAFILTPADIRYKTKMLIQRQQDTKLMLLSFPPVVPLTGNDRFPSHRFLTCGAAGKSFIHINAAGDVEPCPFSHYTNHNILHKEYTAVLNSDFFRLLRARLSHIQKNKKKRQYFTCECASEVSICAKRTGARSTEKPLVRPKCLLEFSKKFHFPETARCL